MQMLRREGGGMIRRLSLLSIASIFEANKVKFFDKCESASWIFLIWIGKWMWVSLSSRERLAIWFIPIKQKVWQMTFSNRERKMLFVSKTWKPGSFHCNRIDCRKREKTRKKFRLIWSKFQFVFSENFLWRHSFPQRSTS
jgi:hypothetical protein